LVKKPVINVDADEEVAGGSLPSPTADIALSSFAPQNAANTLVMESAAVPAMAAGNTEAGPSEAAVYTETVASDAVVGLIKRAWTPLFLPSDENTEPSDESYIDEAKGSGSEEGSEDENEDVEEDEDEDVEEDEDVDVEEDEDEDVGEDVEEADKIDIDQTLRD
jgi:hypothetical protein